MEIFVYNVIKFNTYYQKDPIQSYSLHDIHQII